MLTALRGNPPPSFAHRLKSAQNTYALLTTFNEARAPASPTAPLPHLSPPTAPAPQSKPWHPFPPQTPAPAPAAARRQVDMSGIMELRNDYKDAFLEKHGVKLGFMSAFVKASVSALQEVPAVNGVIDGTDIVYRDYYDVSVAVGTAKGLVVPVLRKCAARAPRSAGFPKRNRACGRQRQKWRFRGWPFARAGNEPGATLPPTCAQRGQALVRRNREGHRRARQEGARRHAERGRHGRRDVHHQQRGGLRLAAQASARPRQRPLCPPSHSLSPRRPPRRFSPPTKLSASTPFSLPLHLLPAARPS